MSELDVVDHEQNHATETAEYFGQLAEPSDAPNGQIPPRDHYRAKFEARTKLRKSDAS